MMIVPLTIVDGNSFANKKKKQHGTNHTYYDWLSTTGIYKIGNS